MDKIMDRTEKAELTVLCLIEKDGMYLLQNRVKDDWKCYALPGGHVEKDESFTDAVIREMQEETGLIIQNPKLYGVKQFPGKNGRYVVLLYCCSTFAGTLVSSDEGQMEWIRPEELGKIQTVNDLELLIKVMKSDELNEFDYAEKNGQWEPVIF